MDEPSFRLAFGRALRRARAAAGLTQADLAERVDVGEKYISHLERGRYTPSAYIVHTLGTILETDLLSLRAANPRPPRPAPLRRKVQNIVEGLSADDLETARRVLVAVFGRRSKATR